MLRSGLYVCTCARLQACGIQARMCDHRPNASERAIIADKSTQVVEVSNRLSSAMRASTQDVYVISNNGRCARVCM
jgi:hypothetical protein